MKTEFDKPFVKNTRNFNALLSEINYSFSYCEEFEDACGLMWLRITMSDMVWWQSLSRYDLGTPQFIKLEKSYKNFKREEKLKRILK